MQQQQHYETTTTTYYDILGVELYESDTKKIRQGYLKRSLENHPDKNPNDVDGAKERFVQIGHAYEVLSDPIKRSIYDREIQQQRQRKSSYERQKQQNHHHTRSTSTSSSSSNNNKSYESYSDFFDETVAGMSEADLAAAVGAAATIGSLVGGMIGAHMMKKGGSSGTNNNNNNSRSAATNGTGTAEAGGGGFGSAILATAGSYVGSKIASELAVSAVRTIHQESIDRIEYKRNCQLAVERGEPKPPPPKSMKDTLGGFIDKIQMVKDVFIDDNHNNDNSHKTTTNSTSRQRTSYDSTTSSSENDHHRGGGREGTFGNGNNGNSGGWKERMTRNVETAVNIASFVAKATATATASNDNNNSSTSSSTTSRTTYH